MTQRATQIVHTPGDMQIPSWLVPVGFVRGAIALLAEVLVLEGVGVSGVGASARDEVMALVGGVRIVAFE